MQKSFDKKKFWINKLQNKTKLFITKIYSNIDKCHIIFALLAPFDKTGRTTWSNENVCGIWFKMSRARIGRKECGDLNELGRKSLMER